LPRANDEVEALLYEYTDLLSILADDPFKPRAFEKAARAVGGYHQDIREFDAKQLMAIPSVGRSIAEKIFEYLRTGKIDDLEELRSRIPEGVRQLMHIPGLGPKKAMLLYQELNITSVEELQEAIETERLAGVKGFGKKTEENILRAIQTMQSSGGRVLLGVRSRGTASGGTLRSERRRTRHLRRITSPDVRDDRRHRPVGGERKSGSHHGCVRGFRNDRPHPGEGRNEDFD
jgi:DNA polymerase/3'-5' exonuclease PolX